MTSGNARPRSRRTVVRAAAWDTPVVASVVVPPAYDLTVQSFQFNEAANWTHPTNGQTALYGLGFVTWRVRICNTGPNEAPAGGLLDIGVGMGPYFDTFSIVNSGGLSLS
ncbi:hypothetical protein NHF46_04115 [Arthrobacter alpinus]|nr:hypothetical protein [Arthrobacter alpinus]